MQVHDLEIVTNEVDAVCATYERLHGVTFGAGEASLGNARTAPLPAQGGLPGRGGRRVNMAADGSSGLRPNGLGVEDADARECARVSRPRET